MNKHYQSIRNSVKKPLHLLKSPILSANYSKGNFQQAAWLIGDGRSGTTARRAPVHSLGFVVDATVRRTLSQRFSAADDIVGWSDSIDLADRDRADAPAGRSISRRADEELGLDHEEETKPDASHLRFR